MSVDAAQSGVAALSQQVVEALIRRRELVATAESLTGGLVVGALTAVPGSSAVVRGGVCAYWSEVKAEVVGVPAEALRTGAVNEAVARELATGARRLFGAQWGCGTTGVAGPDAAPDAPVGTVHIAVAGPTRVVHRQLALTGDRAAIREQTVAQVLRLLLDCFE